MKNKLMWLGLALSLALVACIIVVMFVDDASAHDPNDGGESSGATSGENPGVDMWRTMSTNLDTFADMNVDEAEAAGFTVHRSPVECVAVDVSQGFTIFGGSFASAEIPGGPSDERHLTDQKSAFSPATVFGCVVSWVGFRFD